MTLRREQVEHIERLKQELGVDLRVGTVVSEQVTSRGGRSGISPISPQEGRGIVAKTLNPTLLRMIADLEGR
jgi:hypothetical protein